ncbi:Hypothetical predicted protein [Mytilus galloprovincialis]|uniref:Uncharacterized protein n=1 Tax=Mytilus galloprovincialis TaxID=29158 RepID=A0A8B6E5E9_MYTGA|nr:Hypothetical predicted protein [Mytilus galloprovincialis]
MYYEVATAEQWEGSEMLPKFRTAEQGSLHYGTESEETRKGKCLANVRCRSSEEPVQLSDKTYQN